jgi:O-antigen/teichoic acid export membrane protein
MVDAVIAIIISLVTHSVYALVWGLFISAVLEVLISFIFVKPWPKFAIEKLYFSDIFKRGIWVTAYTVFNYISENADNAVVGKLLGATSLGLYQMAYKISILPITEISEVVSGVVFPIYTKISQDLTRLRSAYLKSLSLVLISSFVLGVVVYVFSSEIVLLVLGEKWVSIVPIIQILIIYGFLRTVGGPASALLLSLRKQKDVSFAVFLRLGILLISIVPFVMTYGLIGAGYAQVLSVIIEVPVILYLAFRSLRNPK